MTERGDGWQAAQAALAAALDALAGRVRGREAIGEADVRGGDAPAADPAAGLVTAAARAAREALAPILSASEPGRSSDAAALASVELAALERAVACTARHPEGDPDAPDPTAMLLRHLSRLDAAVELLAAARGSATASSDSAEESRGVRATAPQEGGTAGRFGVSRAMEPAELEAFLRRRWWGTLAVSEDGRPYAVPVVYGYDGRHVYVASRGGRKVAALEANPIACLTVVEVEEREGGHWASAVVTGRVEFVRRIGDWAAALRALRRQVGRTVRMTPAAIAGMAAARVLRIEPEEITGRVRIG